MKKLLVLSRCLTGCGTDNAFTLIYRPGAQTACEDLARAVSFIFEHAEELEVDTDCYSVWGGSADARMDQRGDGISGESNKKLTIGEKKDEQFYF